MSRGATYLGLLANLRQDEMLYEARRRAVLDGVDPSAPPPQPRRRGPARAAHHQALSTPSRTRPNPRPGLGRFRARRMAGMPRPRAISRSDPSLISNAEMARVFNEIADMLEISGELVYKAVAYRRVADAVERWPDDVAHLFVTGEAPKIPGAGPALSTKLAELATTGQLAYYDRMRAQVPAGLLEILKIPGRRAADREAAARRARHRVGRRAARRRRGGHAARPEGALRPDRGEHPGRHGPPGVAGHATAAARRRCADGRAGRSAARGARRACASSRPGRCGGARPTIGDLDLLAATDDPAAPDRRARRAGGGRIGPERGDRQVEHRAGRRAAGRPDGLPAGRLGQPPGPLHRQQGAQRRAARDGAGARPVAVGEGLQGGRERRAPAGRHRGGGLRAARPAVDRARDARGQRRDPGRARRPPSGARQAHRSAWRHARALGLDRWRRLDRGDGARGARARPRVDGADRPLSVAGGDARADSGARRRAARGDRPPQRRAGAVPHPARHRDGDPRRCQPRLPR